MYVYVVAKHAEIEWHMALYYSVRAWKILKSSVEAL